MAVTLPRAVVRDEGQVVAWGDMRVEAAENGISVAFVQIEVGSGHHAPGVRSELLDRVLDRIGETDVRRMTVTIPLGDSEMIAALEHRCRHVHTHAAGSTCLIEAEL